MADFALAPGEAANIALNSYFALKDWALKQPTAGVESRGKVQDLVLGSGDTNGVFPRNSSVGKSFPGAQLGQTFTGMTGWNTVSGFGYVLHFERGGQRHAVIAVRGTRYELGWYDIGTDFRFAHAGFGEYGRVHKGFVNVFGSMLPQLQREQGVILDADVIHCVGHSLGGAVATLAAGHYAALNRNVRLYTFGSPRVGYRDSHSAFERRIGKGNIYRVAHNRDPITMIATYPYAHVLAPYTEPNNFTLDSPSTSIALANHDMYAYAQSIRDAESWSAVRGIAAACDHSNSKLAQALMADTGMSWFRKLTLNTLAALLTLFEEVLRGAARLFYDAVTGIDVIAAIICDGVKLLGSVGERLKYLLRMSAKWADIPIANDASLTDSVIRAILQTMTTRINQVGIAALQRAASGLQPVPLLIAGSMLLSATAL
jgi:pimeloyl-ACP methyl ester carboxylesterase